VGADGEVKSWMHLERGRNGKETDDLRVCTRLGAPARGYAHVVQARGCPDANGWQAYIVHSSKKFSDQVVLSIDGGAARAGEIGG